MSKRVAKQAEEQLAADYRWLMSNPAGRRLMWFWLTRNGIYQSSFSLNAMEMALKEGERNVGLRLTTDCQAYCAREFLLMQQEHWPQPPKTRNERPDTDTESDAGE